MQTEDAWFVTCCRFDTCELEESRSPRNCPYLKNRVVKKSKQHASMPTDTCTCIVYTCTCMYRHCHTSMQVQYMYKKFHTHVYNTRKCKLSPCTCQLYSTCMFIIDNFFAGGRGEGGYRWITCDVAILECSPDSQFGTQTRH